MRSNTLLAGATLVALLAPAASADVLRVPKEFATIQEAVDAAVAEDIIVVSKGTYAPFSVTDKTDLVIRGKAKPLIDGAAANTPVVSISGSTNVALVGFLVSNAGDRGVDVSDSTSVTIRKCRFESNAGPSVNLDGSGHFVEKSQFVGTDGEAVHLEAGAENVTIEKNLMRDTDTAVSLQGSGHLVWKNRVKDSSNDGFSVLATDCMIFKNRFDGVADDALDVEGDDNVLLKNRVKNVGSNGVELEPAVGDPFAVTGNFLQWNKVMKAGENGFFVGTPGNTFIKNKATKCETFGLLDQAGDGANFYEKNKFGTQQFD
jgi:hypothetical protein